jgi:hypothetical protein
MTTLLRTDRLWSCHRCNFTDVTHEAQPHTRYHPCPALEGLSMPMVEAGSHVKVTIVEREDYVGSETVTTVGGRPIMSVVTQREDGSNDVAVFAPRANAKLEEM